MISDNPLQHQRYHSFDCLRAAMMMLGIWMHGVQCYTELKVYMWPFKDVAQSLAANGRNQESARPFRGNSNTRRQLQESNFPPVSIRSPRS